MEKSCTIAHIWIILKHLPAGAGYFPSTIAQPLSEPISSPCLAESLAPWLSSYSWAPQIPVFLAAPEANHCSHCAASLHRRDKKRMYLWYNLVIMFAWWHLTPMRFMYPKNDSSLLQVMTFRGFKSVLGMSTPTWEKQWCFGRILYK